MGFSICCQCIYSIWRHLTKVFGSGFLSSKKEVSRKEYISLRVEVGLKSSVLSSIPVCPMCPSFIPDAIINALTTNKQTHIRGKKTLFLSFVKQFLNFL